MSKKFVDVQLTRNAESDTPFATINTDALSTNRIVTFPDLDLTILGTESTQTILNKTYVDSILADGTDQTKKVTIDVSNMNTSSTTPFGFPTNAVLNNTTVTNLLVTELATQTLSNKTLLSPQIKVNAGDLSGVTFDTSNVTGNRTIRFPDSDATLLSTANTSLEDVSFGAGIGAQTLVGRTRLQQFFYAGF